MCACTEPVRTGIDARERLVVVDLRGNYDVESHIPETHIPESHTCTE